MSDCRPPGLDRRALLRAAAVLPAVVLAGCAVPAGAPGTGAGPPTAVDPGARLTARPGEPTSAPEAAGLHALDLGSGPEVLLHVPADVGQPAGTGPVRLVVALHGAGETARDGLDRLLRPADAHGLLVLAPAAHGVTWDVLTGGWGQDVRRIDQALAAVFARYRVDPARLAISGFSDGASYALSLGLANADLFTHLIAFSPGVLVAGPPAGTPRVFVSHGLADEVLPIDDSTRRIVAQLDAAHIPTEVRVFDGPHTVPPDVAEAAVRWLLR